jgi:hypothetical protein
MKQSVISSNIGVIICGLTFAPISHTPWYNDSCVTTSNDQEKPPRVLALQVSGDLFLLLLLVMLSKMIARCHQ